VFSKYYLNSLKLPTNYGYHNLVQGPLTTKLGIEGGKGPTTSSILKKSLKLSNIKVGPNFLLISLRKMRNNLVVNPKERRYYTT
jgi:hypothetical protein